MLPSSIISHIAEFVPTDDMSLFASSLMPEYERQLNGISRAMTKKINKLGSSRVQLVSFLMQLIANPELDRDPPFTDEALQKIDAYSVLLQNSSVVGERREAMNVALLGLISARLELNAPLITIASPLDMLVALHFTRLDSILELADYFKMTEMWIDLITRRSKLNLHI